MVYTDLAYLYDQFMQETDYNEWIDFTNKHVKDEQKSIVDLGCGTGKLTIELAKQEKEMVGVDISIDMLTQAEQNAQASGVKVFWVNQDIKELSGHENVDAFISYFDVLNYITNKTDLKTVFEHVYASLNDQGVFLFDVHSYAYVNDNMINHTFTEVTEEAAYMWDCIAGENPGEMYHELTFFAAKENGDYERYEESHYQRTYEIETYVNLLKEVGFKNVEYDVRSIENVNSTEAVSEKVFFVAKK